MKKRARVTTLGVCLTLLASGAKAQNIDLNGGNVDVIWRGTAANSNAGLWMDQGAVGNDGRADLIVGVPGTAGIVGRVYVIYGGPNRTGNLLLSSADAVITGATAGDLFGWQTAAGHILRTEGSGPRDLLVAAPDAMGGRGIVYLFSGGFSSAASLTTANAVFRVIGAPGDHLGRSLATADVNRDGYRELVLGAVDKVYVIPGGAGLSTAPDIDLQLPHTNQTIAVFGLGSVLAAGDVTGDGITDVLAPSTTSGAVFLYKGTSAGTLSTAPVALWGIKVTDRAGESLRLGDIDSDGDRDIIIGAPGADGPDNVRFDSGAVYIVWGGTDLANRTLDQADVTFYGEAAGQQLGAFVTSGDVNRDTPDDLVMLAQGGSSGAGDLVVYYGSSQRTSYGVLGPNGRRVVDLMFGGSDRKIFGDPSVGPIRNAQVFEVTGEGARDIIAAVPSADANAGRVYFTVSPRLRLGASSVVARIIEGETKSQAITVQNSSSIGIGWSATANRPWIVLPSAGGSTVATAPGQLMVQTVAGTMPPGTYTGTVTVRSTGEHLEMALQIPVTLVIRRLSVWPSDYNGDARADPVIFRPSTGTWFVPGLGPITWGGAGDIPLKGDFDGDGLADISVFRPSTGVWYIRTALTQLTYTFGASIDTPVPADYDGDGRTDVAVFRPSASTWFIALSGTPGHTVLQWGGQGDVPVPADYDGDRKADIAIFRPSTGEWFIYQSSNGQMLYRVWGGQGDQAVIGDYNGDGRTDVAVFRPSTGKWYVLLTQVNWGFEYTWGGAGDVPVAADFDTDGKTDVAVFRPSTGAWYVIQSSNGQGIGFTWGGANDIPLLRP